MRKIGILVIGIISLLIGCNETSSTVCTFSQKEFVKEMTDSMVIYIESYGSPIEMKGNLKLIGGACTISLKAPSGDTIFSVDTTFITDTIFPADGIHLNDTIFSIDTLFTPDTILLYHNIYNKKFKAIDSFTVNEKFDRILGKWTFLYKTENINDTIPVGNFNFVLKYNN